MATPPARIESFPPLGAPGARVLVLGSIPGVRSLETRQYYAHPQNAFWRILGALLGGPVESYADRVALIERSRIVLWDVLKGCERPGSLDSSIVGDTIEVNDFAGLLVAQPRIGHVFCNGARSHAEFTRRVLPGLPPDLAARIRVARLPSTSPAHAGMRLDDKIRAWAAILEPLGRARPGAAAAAVPIGG